MDIKLLYQHFCKSNSVSTDTRKINTGDIFFALKGENFDGNQYADKALKAGARLAVVDDPSVVKSENFFICHNVLQALQSLAHYHRKQFNIPMVGLTGSNGKTTSKELIGAVLKENYNVLITEGNLNNHIGVPLTLLKLNKQHEIAVIEMGANHSGEIASLCEIAEPTHGLITNIGKAHLEGFGSIQGIQQAKGELFAAVKKRNGWIFVNGSDAQIIELANSYINTIMYGFESTNQVSGTCNSGEELLSIKWKVAHQEFRKFSTQLTGKYNCMNLLAALAVGTHFNIPADSLEKALSQYTPTNQRSQIVRGKTNTIILDAYNANPSSMEVAIQNMVESFDGKKAVILGDMFELGVESEREHQAIVNTLNSIAIEICLVVGSAFSSTTIGNKCKSFGTVELLKDYLKENSITGYTILLKGSRGMKMENILPLLTE